MFQDILLTPLEMEEPGSISNRSFIHLDMRSNIISQVLHGDMWITVDQITHTLMQKYDYYRFINEDSVCYNKAIRKGNCCTFELIDTEFEILTLKSKAKNSDCLPQPKKLIKWTY